MSITLTLINRYAAPFAAGVCAAAATKVEQPVAIASFVCLAGAFALICLEAEARFIERFTDGALMRCLGTGADD